MKLPLLKEPKIIITITIYIYIYIYIYVYDFEKASTVHFVIKGQQQVVWGK